MFFHHLLRSPIYKTRIKTASRGIVESRLRLYTDDLYRIEALLPPKDEQAAIVRFLDHADLRIRRAIAAKQKLIRLLEEQKRATSHRAVTRGVDPDARLKPSGVEWLGDVPEHWEIRKIRSLFRRQGSGTTPVGDRYYDGGIPWVMSGDLNDAAVTTTKRSVTGEALEEVGALKLYPQKSLVVAMYGATIGKTGVIEMAACTNQACCVFSDPFPSVSVEFLQLVVNVARPALLVQSFGGGQPNINAGVIKSLRVPLPPLKEQMRVLEWIHQNGFGDAIAAATIEIALLKEYRARLIADVVTGKLDVREVATKLPKMIELADTGFDTGEDSEDDSREDFGTEDQAA
jgi:type I restriction enzyme S subunit